MDQSFVLPCFCFFEPAAALRALSAVALKLVRLLNQKRGVDPREQLAVHERIPVYLLYLGGHEPLEFAAAVETTVGHLLKVRSNELFEGRTCVKTEILQPSQARELNLYQRIASRKRVLRYAFQQGEV